MKSSYVAAGLVAGLLLAGSARADVVYDTITGQTENATVRDSLSPKVAANRGPLGDAFTVSSNEWLSSVTLRLRNIDTTTVGDTGAILVYLVASTGTGASNVPSASGLALSAPILLGQINDSQVAPNGTGTPNPAAFANIKISASDFLTAGTTYWIEVADAADPLNGNGNSVASFLKWGMNSDVGGLGVPGGPNNIFSVANSSNSGLAGYNSTDNTFTAGGEVFEMQIQTPEPASLALLGAGVIGLGVARRRRNNISPK